MGYSARLLRATAVTALMISALQLPALTEEAQEQRQLAPAQTKQADEPVDVLLEVEGVLEEGDRTLEDGSLYDVYPIEGQAGQTLSIRLESSDFDTFLTLVDAQGQKTAQNDNISTINTDSRLTVTLPANGTYSTVTNAFDKTGRGRYQLTMTTATATDLRSAEADRLFQQGLAQYQTAQFRDALHSFEQALAIYQEIKDSAGEASTFLLIGEANRLLGNYPAALDFYQQSLDIARRLEDPRTEAQSLLGIGFVNQSLGNYPAALDFYQQSLDITRQLKDSATEASNLGNIGNVNRLLGNYPAALDYYQQSLEIARRLEDPATEAQNLNNIGVVNRLLGNYPAALDYFRKSLEIARRLEDPVIEALNLNNLGASYLFEHKAALAEEVLLSAVNLLDSLRSTELSDADKVSLFETQKSTFRLLQQALVIQAKYEPALLASERGRSRAFAELYSGPQKLDRCLSSESL